jgi:hypothetical protein
VASLIAHHSYLRALSDEPPADQAERLIDEMSAADADRFGGLPCRSFELITP